MPLLFNDALEYAIGGGVNQNGLKFSGTHRVLVYADDVNILGRNIYKENTEALVVSSK